MIDFDFTDEEACRSYIPSSQTDHVKIRIARPQESVELTEARKSRVDTYAERYSNNCDLWTGKPIGRKN